MGLSPYLELLRAFLLLQFEAELLGPRLQLADLLRGLRQSLLQLVELALLLLPQAGGGGRGSVRRVQQLC